jgi:hypothetical protein
MTATATEHVQEQVLGAVRKSQEMTIDAIKKVVETVSAAQAKLPAAAFDGKLHILPLAERLPGLSSLPEPEAVVSSAFDFLGRLLADQRKFADEMFRATAALRPAANTSTDTEPAKPESTRTEGDTKAAGSGTVAE